jgi:sigma-B regulation protein RsbU (phosphoserine phosphatase)
MSCQASAMEDRTEWATACDVQRRFMQRPATAVGTLDYGARCRQVHQLGGDCFDFMSLPGNRLALAVGDASGKGLAAALMIGNVQSSLRTAAWFADGDGPAVLTAVNRQLYASSLDGRYATLFYGVFDAATRILRYVNAGHNPPLLLRRDGSMEWLETGGAPLGMFAEWNYEEGELRLDPGDVLVACTDGVTEATDAFGEEWGVEGLRRAAVEHRRSCADGMVQGIFDALDEFSRGCQTDDATVAVVRVL